MASHTLTCVQELEHAIIMYLEDFLATPWIFVLVFSIALLDGFFPVVPGETSVIVAGASAASVGYPNVALIILAASVGAFIGDHISYSIGRFAFGPITQRLTPGSKWKKIFDWAHDALLKRGGIALVVARYIPGGRTALTITCGAVRYPLRKFAFFEVIAASTWGIYSGMVGFVAGHIFKDRPLLALALGFVFAMVCAGIIELIQKISEKRAATREALATDSEIPTPRTESADENTPV